MSDSPFAETMRRAGEEASAKGHVLGGWEPIEESEGCSATCNRCGGKLTVSRTNKLTIVGSDPFMGWEYCPADNPELMKRIADDWNERLARVYALILSWPPHNKREDNHHVSDIE